MLFSTLEMKQVQVARLEKIVKSLEEQQMRGQAQRTRYEERIAIMETELADYKSKANTKTTESGRQHRLESFNPPFNSLIPDLLRASEPILEQRSFLGGSNFDRCRTIGDHGNPAYSFPMQQSEVHHPTLEVSARIPQYVRQNNSGMPQESSIQADVRVSVNDQIPVRQTPIFRPNPLNGMFHQNRDSRDSTMPGGGDAILDQTQNRLAQMRFLQYEKAYNANVPFAKQYFSRLTPKRNNQYPSYRLPAASFKTTRKNTKSTQTTFSQILQPSNKQATNTHTKVYSVTRIPLSSFFHSKENQNNENVSSTYNEDVMIPEQDSPNNRQNSIHLQISRKRNPKIIAVRKYSV